MSFETIRLLRETPGITTTLSQSEHTQDRTVVRRIDLATTWPWSWQWLESELEAIRRARLDNVVPTQVAQKDVDHVELVRPFVPGLNIREWSAQRTPRAGHLQLQLMCNLFHALARMHKMGIAYGGIKPANIIVTEGGNELVLVDVSVTRSQLAAESHQVDMPECWYVLPEEPGLTHPTASFAADIFAAGWVLLEATAEANRTTSALRRAEPLRGHPAELSHLVDLVGVPAAVRSIFLRLLNPIAGARYESADHVLADLEAVLATDTASERSPLPHDSPAYVEPPLVGRHNELATLIACAEGAARSSGSVAVLVGNSGIGKSRLLDAATVHAASAGMTVTRADAFDHAPARPLGLFAGPFRDMAEHLNADRHAARRVREQMGRWLPAALEQVPELTGALGGETGRSAPESALSSDASASAPTAVALLLQSVFDTKRGGLIVVDDCQWADDLSWQVLAKLTSTIAQTKSRVSVICSCRHDGVGSTNHPGLTEATFIYLQSLSGTDTETLIRSVGQPIPEDVLPDIVDYSRGNPLEALLFLQAIVEWPDLDRGPDQRYPSEPVLMPVSPLSQHRLADTEDQRSTDMDVFASSRLTKLSVETRRALGQSAVLGRRFPADLLCATIDAKPTSLDRALAEAARGGILREVSDGDGSEFEFVHDRLREAVLGTISSVNRQELHERAAQALARAPGARSDYDIAYHFHHAGRAASAMPYALRAGEAGLKQNALDVAEGNFKIAEAAIDLDSMCDDLSRFRVYEGLGTVHMLLGNYDLAAKELGWAYALTGSLAGMESARVATLLGELSFKTGRLDDAAKMMRQSIHDLGLHVPSSPIVAAVASVGEVVRHLCGWFWRRIRPNRMRWWAERDRLAARVHNRLVYEWWFVRSPIWIIWAALRGIRYGRSSGSTRELAQAYSTAAVVSGSAPVLAPFALRLANLALRLRQTADEGWGIAQSHHFRGFVLYVANRYDEAIAAFDTAIASFDVLGDRWEQVAAMWQKALCLARRGHLHEAGVLARDTYWEGKRRGDRIGAGTALAIWVRCLPQDVNMETISRELEQTDPSDHHTLAMLHCARAWRLSHADQHGPALDSIQRADELIREAGLRNHFLALIVTSQTQILRLSIEAGPAGWTEECRRQTRGAQRALARARRSAAVFGGERSATFREWSMMSYRRGRRWRGRIFLTAATRSAFRYSADGELAACSQVATMVGLNPGRGVLRRLPPVSEQCRRLGIRVDRGIVESATSRDALVGAGSARHHALLDAVSSLVASDNVQEVLDKLREATMSTTTARKVEILQGAPASGEWTEGLTVGRGRPIPATDGRPMKSIDSVTKRVTRNGGIESSVVAAFPLGDGEEQGAVMAVLAALAGAVIEREGLRKESVEQMVAVQEAERERIARDLHDEFGHIFSSALEGLRPLRESDVRATRDAADLLREIVRNGVRVSRSVAWSLRPSGLDDLGLIGCIEQYVEDCRYAYQMRIEITTTGELSPSAPSVSTAVFRIVQEALTNLGRHSRSKEASVTIVSSPSRIRAVIEDGGVGFDVEAVNDRKSLGLVGMHERARLIGGSLTVESSPGNGTSVVLVVPVT